MKNLKSNEKNLDIFQKEYETGKMLVEYGNEFALSINTFNAYELDLFLSLLYSARKLVKDHMKISETENLMLELPYSMLSKVLQGNTSLERLGKGLLKIFNTNIFFKKQDYIEVKHIFETLSYNKKTSVVTFELKKEYIHIFFNLTGNFTQHEILEFTSFKGKYTKKIYQIIMAHKFLKKKEFSIELFKKILDVPQSYDWTDIRERVILQSQKEFQGTNIENFEVEKIKEGKKITKIILHWDIKEPEIIKELDDILYPKEQSKTKDFDYISKEDEEKAIKQLESQGMHREFLGEMKRISKTMYYNTLKNCLEGSK